MSEIILRDYQQRGVDELRAAYRGGKRAPLYVLSTGGGKTVVFSYITKNAAARGRRVMILVHRQELLRQSSEALDGLEVEHGLIAPKHSQTHDLVQVASVQTLVRRLDKIIPPNLIIIDEAHHSVAGSWAKVIHAFPNAAILGVTATPCRMDGRGLGIDAGGCFDAMVCGPSIKELIAAGHLSPPLVYAPPTALNLDDVKTRMGDYAKNDMAEAVDKPVITGSAVEHYGKICPGVPAIAFCASVAHADHVAAEFRAAGWRASSIDGTMHDGERRGLITALGRGNMDVLTSCDLVGEGVDIPVVGAAILLRPTQSLSLNLQQIGRALRPYPGKQFAIILDHVGNCHRHGLPDTVREWSLDGEQRTGGSKKSPDVNLRVKQCEKCYAVHAPAPTCPQCGHEYEDGGRSIEEVEGELQRILEEDAEFMRRAQEVEKKRMRQELGYRKSQCKSHDDFKKLGDELGYKPGWAGFQYGELKRRGFARK